MKDYDIDRYLAEINVVVDDLRTLVHFVGLCQGGGDVGVYAGRFRGKVRSLVLAGAPIDTSAGDGSIKRIAHRLPMSVFQELVSAGGRRTRGEFMLAGRKNIHPGEQYLNKYILLHERIADKCYLTRSEHFERWYETRSWPSRYCSQAVAELVKMTRFAEGESMAWGENCR
jgi:pimeloyl-ACP methyl ester carboxylesterase